jgi:hypothetical protein
MYDTSPTAGSAAQRKAEAAAFIKADPDGATVRPAAEVMSGFKPTIHIKQEPGLERVVVSRAAFMPQLAQGVNAAAQPGNHSALPQHVVRMTAAPIQPLTPWEELRYNGLVYPDEKVAPPPDKVWRVHERSNTEVCHSDIQRCAKDVMLNDPVINFGMALLQVCLFCEQALCTLVQTCSVFAKASRLHSPCLSLYLSGTWRSRDVFWHVQDRDTKLHGTGSPSGYAKCLFQSTHFFSKLCREPGGYNYSKVHAGNAALLKEPCCL